MSSLLWIAQIAPALKSAWLKCSFANQHVITNSTFSSRCSFNPYPKSLEIACLPDEITRSTFMKSPYFCSLMLYVLRQRQYTEGWFDIWLLHSLSVSCNCHQDCFTWGRKDSCTKTQFRQPRQLLTFRNIIATGISAP